VDKFWGRRYVAIVSASFLILSVFGLPSHSVSTITGVPTVSTPTQMLNKLSVKAESTTTYSRSSFKHWIDADKDSCNTRLEVLISESTKKVNIGSKCKLSGGAWTSKYDNLKTTDPSKFDVDHFVPLNEAWQSGAHKWNASTRTSFANDLSFGGSLIAVSASSNRSKSDRDPNNWMPPNSKYHCTYVANWIAVKYRWSLSVDSAEKTFLASQLKKCGSAAKSPVPSKAKIVLGSTSGSSPSTPPTSGGGGLDPRFTTCTAAKAAGYGPYYKSKDPEYYWYVDRDKDGIACE
jgi:hypothetical protein